MSAESSAPQPFEIDKAAPICQNSKYDEQTQMYSRFRPVSVTDRKVGSSESRDEKRTESDFRKPRRRRRRCSSESRDEKRTERIGNDYFVRVQCGSSSESRDEKRTES